jgi:membrane-bound ClpP family serine protease
LGGETTVTVVLFICGLTAMCVELFLPGAVIGILGFLAVLASIIYAFATGHNTTGVVLLLCAIAFLPAFFLIWRHVLGKFWALRADEKGFHPSTTVREDLVGAEGLALSLLRPSGIAQLNERRYDVVTRGEMIEKGARIRVIEVSGNRIVVTKLS